MSLRRTSPRPSPAPRLSPRAEADHLVERLRELYAAPEWLLLSEVRTATGAGLEGARIADAVAINTYPGRALERHAFEVKRTREDFARELRAPEKRSAVASYCHRFWFVVPAPWKRVVLSSSELPEDAGLIEVGTGEPLPVFRAPEPIMPPFEPSSDFYAALFRAAGRPVEREHQGLGAAPLRSIVRRLDRGFVALECGHRAPRPLGKHAPSRLPCFACDEDLPVHREVIVAALEEAGAEDLERYAAQIDRRRRRLEPTGPSLAACPPDRSGVLVHAEHEDGSPLSERRIDARGNAA